MINSEESGSEGDAIEKVGAGEYELMASRYAEEPIFDLMKKNFWMTEKLAGHEISEKVYESEKPI